MRERAGTAHFDSDDGSESVAPLALHATVACHSRPPGDPVNAVLKAGVATPVMLAMHAAR